MGKKAALLPRLDAMLKKLEEKYQTEGLHGLHCAIRRRILQTILPKIQYTESFKSLVSSIEKLNRNWSNQLANLGSSAEMRPWTRLDDELRAIVRNLKPKLYLADPDAPTICTVALGSEYQSRGRTLFASDSRILRSPPV